MRNRLAVGGIVLLLFIAVGVTFQIVKARGDVQIEQVGTFNNNLGAQEEPTLGLADALFYDNATDVIGTSDATTTVGVAFGNATTGGVSVTSTYASNIAGAGLAIYTIQNTDASSTSRINLEFQASQDYYCQSEVASGGNLPLESEINWFDIGDHMRGKAQTTTWTNVTSTNFIAWANPQNGVGKTVIFENLNYECIRLIISGNSSTVWAQIATKGDNY